MLENMSGLDPSGKPTVVYVLALISGLLIIIVSVYNLFRWFYSPFAGWYPPMWCPMCGWAMGRLSWGFFIPFVLLHLASGVIILLAGYMAYANPANIQTWGTIIVIFSVLSLLSGWSLVIGAVLGLVSGILALTWKKS